VSQPVDTLNRSGAEELVKTIREYWRGRGVKIALRIVEESYSENKRPFYGVRSDLRNGLPRFNHLGDTC
jgi:hypothetical protein